MNREIFITLVLEIFDEFIFKLSFTLVCLRNPIFGIIFGKNSSILTLSNYIKFHFFSSSPYI